MEINSKMKKQIQHISLVLMLLLLGGMMNEAWAYKVTYHILTLPINSSTAGMVGDVNGKRLEAIRVIVDNAATIELPAHFKSPLAENFEYYANDQVEKSAATQLYENNATKGIIYNLKASPVETSEGASVTSDCDIYVTYDFVGNSNPIAALDGTKTYIIGAKAGFLAYNRGRNNRPAVLPRANVTEDCLISDDFVKIDNPGINNTYWTSGDNKNKQSDVEKQFYFQFQLYGSDPYNIIIRTAYNRDYTYIEKNDGTTNFVYKWYKGGALFGVASNNQYIASDDHKLYTTPWVSGSDNPINPDSETKPGNFHGQAAPIWGSFALLNNTTNTGYVFMGSRTYKKDDGSFDAPTGSNNNYKYLYLKFDNANLTINRHTPAEATTKYTIDPKFYEIKTVNFHVKTPFGNMVTAPVTMSDYKILNNDIAMSDIPSSLRRKYCTFTKFYKDAELTTEITKYSEMTGTDIYVGYQVQNTPFKAITPAASYDADTWKAATWYELTDESSIEASGKKLKYDGTTNFKNDGASGEYTKASEYAFIGDPYELRVVLRSATSGATPTYVGASGNPDTDTQFTASTSETAGYKWEIPDDDTNGSFLLRLYSGSGHWNWTAGNRSEDVTYGTNMTVASALTSNAQTVTFNITRLTAADGNYIKVTKGETEDDAQVTATTPALTSGIGSVDADGNATVTAAIAANSSGADKTFTLTVTEYNSSNEVVGTATTITVTQGTTPFTGNTVEYSTSSSTRVKVLELPEKTFTYKIVDKSGRIAVTASASQTIFSPLSLASIPSIIVSPFILDERVYFYNNYTDNAGRSTLTSEIFETPNADAPIYVKYETTNLNSKPFKLSEDQEIFVRLNGEYIYYDAGTLKSTAANSDSDDRYKWKLRGQDPYAMLLDNMGARTHLEVTGNESIMLPTDDNGTTASQSRQNGAWVKLNVDLPNITDGTDLVFDTDRADAQQFIAKSSARAGVYEVMVATGDGVDASTIYYNIGRPDATTVKIYSNATYQASDDDEIKFRLEENVTYTYHLIDKAKHELLTVSSLSPELVLPAEYQSPLVGAANYSYYDIGQFDVSGEGANAVYTLKGSATKLTNISSLLATYTYNIIDADIYNALDESNKLTASSVADMESEAKKYTAIGHYYYQVSSYYYDVNVSKPCYHDIWVTYKKNDLVTFNDNGHPYMLKFLNPYADGYYLEDGKDNLTPNTIEAVYPYTNGDGNLNIYGTAMNEEQMNGGANTRPRWVWYFENPTGYTDDPYHVRIRSQNKISYNDVPYYTYLQTYAVHFEQDADANTKHIVTGGCLPRIASEEPTEYMVLGTEGHYKLLTTNPINETVADGTADKDKRYYVNSLEQYWKTYNMVKLNVLGIPPSTDAPSGDKSKWVVPNEPLETTYDSNSLYKKYNESHDPDLNYRDFLYQQMGWHSYEAYASAVRWNGYNDEGKHTTRVIEQLEHWYQTFDMGNGDFDIEDANIPPVLVLLDRHGWEIMRKPLPTSTYPNGDELDDLRAYDSPMVKEYHFFNNATKASGCHKYSLRIQNKALRDEIKLDGKAYTSTSLAALPPLTATGVKDDNGIFQDQYVTYTVKEEYEKSYDYSFTDNGNDTYTETGTPSKFLVLQNGRFLKKENNNERNNYFSKPIWEHTNPTGGNVYDLILSPRNNTVDILDGSGNIADFNFWYVGPNLDIDKEMGFKWALAGTTEYETKKTYADKTKVDYMQTTGFDPYNLQIRIADETDNGGDPRYITSHMTSAALDNGVMVGSYDSEKDANTTNITLAAHFSFDGVDPEVTTGSEGHDHTNLKISNQTFMAVSDANGNMQLMPRFDHTLRVNTEMKSPYLTTLEEPKTNEQTATADNNNSMDAQTTFLVRPQVFEYLIIDNEGREALRYKRSGEYYPTITEHFKSPLATDFKYYKNLILTDGKYTEVSTKADITAKEITGSFAEAELNGDNVTVYVRYSYDEDADNDNHILQGKWFTIDLNSKDVIASGALASHKAVASDTDYNTEKDKLSSDGEYYFRIGENSYIYKKVTVTGSGASKAETESSESEWTTTLGTGVSLLQGTSKPATIDKDAKTWQWKFLAAPTDPSSEYYEAPDPYAIELYNRNANYATTLEEPSPMSVPIKVNGKDRFSLLSHPEGGYALAVNGMGTYIYSFLNGAAMTNSVAATTTAENRQKITVDNAEAFATARAALNVDGEYYYKYGNGDAPLTYSYKKVTVTGGSPDGGADCLESDWNNGDQYNFTVKVNALSPGAQLIVNSDVTHNYTYNVINNAGALAVNVTQTDEEATVHHYAPYLPEAAQTPLLNDETDYVYYGNVTETAGVYSVVPATKLFTLYGLYDDVVYVRYEDYNVETTPYLVPNVKAVVDSKVARGSGSNDVALNISGGLPYNIIWENDNIMQSTNGNAISDGGSHALDGNQNYVWYITGGDPYALKIKHKGGKYVNGSTTLVEEASARQFMLLKKSGYDYGVLAEVGDNDSMLSFEDGDSNPSTDPVVSLKATPNKFIFFGLSVHDLIYHLIIANSCPDHDHPASGEYVDIPSSVNNPEDPNYIPATNKLRVYGTTQRDLTSVNDGEGDHYTGEKYQLGETLEYGGNHVTYCHDAGTVSIGDKLEVPAVFDRPNCTFEYYIEGVYDYNSETGAKTANATLNAMYQGLKRDELMSDPELIDKTVVVNIVYQFDTEVATNTGLGFVTSTDQNLWYTLETLNDGTPYLARYTNTQGLKTVAGRETRYTNDYLFTPVGDVYGFKMYNRYFLKNSNISGDDNTKMMTTTALADAQTVTMAVPASGYEIYELTAGDTPGYFRIHPVANIGATKYYVNQVGTSLQLGTTPSEWTFGLDRAMLEPYYLGAGNVGGLNTAGKASYKAEIDKGEGEGGYKITDLQAIVYNDENIVGFADGYYRLHSQPGIPGISPVRYASGYLHDIEKTAGDESTAIPMHFYSKIGVNGTFNGEDYPLKTGFTVSNATRGDIPVPATEEDPSTIFRVVGGDAIANRTISNVTFSTQGLNVIGNKMGTGAATTYRMIDIGGGVVVLIEPTTSNYLNFTQTGNIYDLKYSAANSERLDDVKWCVEPADNQGLKVTMNDGGDDHYYATFYAPFDVLLPDDDGDKKYDAYICNEWSNTIVYPKKVPAVGETYDEGKFVPAGSAVIFRSTDDSGSMTLSLPNSTPSSSLSSSVFSGEYLERMLAPDASHYVFTFGLPFTSSVSINDADGSITSPAPVKATEGVGFYINATSNKEHDPMKSSWVRNNRYVLHNKIYYRETGGGGGGARQNTRGVEFVPVVFDDDEDSPELFGIKEENRRVYDNRVYDLQGRCVATEEQVKDGTWRQNLRPGIYIINGRKIRL